MLQTYPITDTPVPQDKEEELEDITPSDTGDVGEELEDITPLERGGVGEEIEDITPPDTADIGEELIDITPEKPAPAMPAFELEMPEEGEVPMGTPVGRAIGKFLTEKVPFWKYFDPEERERFKELSTIEKAGEIAGEAQRPQEMAAKELPFTKYIDPEEREAFNALSQDKKIKRILLETLETALLIGTEGMALAGKQVLKKLPKTARAIEAARKAKIAKGPKGRLPPLPKPHKEAQHRKAVLEAVDWAIKHPGETFEKGVSGLTGEKKRVALQIMDLIKQGAISNKELGNVLTHYNITPTELAYEIRAVATESGQYLNKLSQFAKKTRKMLPDDPIVNAILEKPIPKAEWYTYIGRGLKRIESTRRMMLVTQASTAARNAISQAGRYTLNVFEDVILGVMKTAAGTHPKVAFQEALGDIGAISRRLSPSGRKELLTILEKYPDEAGRMVSAPVHDIVVGGKVSKLLMKMNTVQEYFFRRMAFDAKLSALCKAKGIPKAQATREMFSEAVEHSLRVTFAAGPKSKWVKDLLSFWNKSGLTLVQPFPRFWGNAIKFIAEFNPTGFIGTAHHLAKGNPVEAARAASKAFMGTAMLGMAMAIRTSEHAGERYYEVKIGKPDPETGKQRLIDLRGFAPFTSYLFIAEAMLHPDRITPMDVTQGILGINRIAGTGLAIIDIIRGKEWGSVKESLAEIGGQYFGGFTTPLRQFKDIAGTFSKEEAKYRETRESGLQRLYGPAISNIPGLHRLLPEVHKVTEEEAIKAEEPWLKQISGLIIKRRSALETEMERLNMSVWRLAPRTGDRRLDREIVEYMGPRVDRTLSKIIKGPKYKQSDDLEREKIIRDEIGEIRRDAKEAVATDFFIERLVKMEDNHERFSYLRDLAERGHLTNRTLRNLRIRKPRILEREDWGELARVQELRS